uniref:Uncharacterized protein n=1 Tax=Setaria viridis TaxID=4556 RepID=A0A4U6VMK9_SETVI|nr:hypothetical protein SEVIR_3G360900v2 [Setaria viridis]
MALPELTPTPWRRSSSASRPMSLRTSSALPSFASPGAASSPTRPSSAATAISTERPRCSASSRTARWWLGTLCLASSPPRRGPPSPSRRAAAATRGRSTAATAASSCT